MSRGSLSDAVRAAGYAMATSEELLSVDNPTVVVRRPEPQRQPVAQVTEPPSKPAEPRTFRTFFGSLAVWA